MGWYKQIFQKQTPLPAKQVVAELTEFELSASHKILLTTENMIEELLQHICDQQEIIQQYEAELKRLRSLQDPSGTIKIVEEGSRTAS